MPQVCSRKASSESPIAEGYIAFWPVTWRPNATVRGVLVTHGASSDHTLFLATASGYADPAAIAASGVACVCADNGGASTWGNDASVAALTNAMSWLTAAPLSAKSDKVVLAGGSMGALVALNWAKANPTKVAAIHMTIPAVDLADIHDNNRGGFAASIETAYGGASGYAAAVAAHNPAVDTGSFTGFPMRLYYSSDDPVVIASTVTAFAAATGAEAISMGAVGHATGSPYSAAAMAQWVGRYV